MAFTQFEWDETKSASNLKKHGVAFEDAQLVFTDPQRVIARDLAHSETEDRFYCFGQRGGGVLTVRFTHRSGMIRIFDAGYWRKGKQIYDKENNLHR
jgi:uncharacterized protein